MGVLLLANNKDDTMLVFFDVPLLWNLGLKCDSSRFGLLTSRIAMQLVMRYLRLQSTILVDAIEEVRHDFV